MAAELRGGVLEEVDHPHEVAQRLGQHNVWPAGDRELLIRVTARADGFSS